MGSNDIIHPNEFFEDLTLAQAVLPVPHKVAFAMRINSMASQLQFIYKVFEKNCMD